MKYYLISGEASGDLHGSNLMKAIQRLDSSADFRFWGGDLMQAVGGKNVSHFKERAFMGFLEVIKNLKKVLSFLRICKKDLMAYQPDVVILIDYPGFNLRLAKFAKLNGFKVFYYISPQLWAWKENRVELVRKYVDRMFVILPFEKDFYQKHGIAVDFVGHPLLDAVAGIEKDESFLLQENPSKKPIIALLPGSRKQEIKVMLPIMLRLQKSYPDYLFVVAGAPSIADDFYLKFIRNEQVLLVKNKTYSLLQVAEVALVSSGTATLETALFDVPQVVCYKGSNISYWIAKRLIKVKYISLVNLIMDNVVVKELIQNELTDKNLNQELKSLVIGGLKRREMKDAYKALRVKLGGQGASEKTAQLMLEYLK
jgi:lipid-A-disaccharide synthase